MKYGSTIILRIVISALGLIAIAITLVTLSMLVRGQVGLYAPMLFGAYVSVVPFLIALYQTWKLLGYIDKNKAFSVAAVKSLKNIKYAALIFGALYIVVMPFIYWAAQYDDAPGVIVMGLALAGGAFVVATSAAVGQKLSQSAVDIKSENDLTV